MRVSSHFVARRDGVERHCGASEKRPVVPDYRGGHSGGKRNYDEQEVPRHRPLARIFGRIGTAFHGRALISDFRGSGRLGADFSKRP